MTASNPKTIANHPTTKSRKTHQPVQELAQHAVEAALSKKASDIVIMDMRKVSGVADLFVLCTGSSDLQIKATVEAIKERILEHAGERPWHIEGYEGLQWVLMDYVDLVVHVFSQEKRTFYDLERLWGDAPRESVPEDVVLSTLALLRQETK